mgnify:FL=1
MKWFMRLASSLLILAASHSSYVYGYQNDLHQQLTFLAAKQISRCDAMLPADQRVGLSALDARYIVRANLSQAKSNFFVKMFRWNYLNHQQDKTDAVLGIIDTRFNNHFSRLLEDHAEADNRQDRLKAFGSLISYIQEVSSPAHVVPVFTSRWWRLSFVDRFDRFPVDVDRIERALTTVCSELMAQGIEQDGQSFKAGINRLLHDTATQTLREVRAPIDGMPAYWTAFWEPATDAQGFGNYGVAGNNFGERTRFSCQSELPGEDEPRRCLLLENDPLYQDFAHRQHLSAVRATMKAILMMPRGGA